MKSFQGTGRLGLEPRVHDMTLAAVLERHGGNRSKAAKQLGLAAGRISGRIWKAKPGSPLFKFQKIKSRLKVDDVALVAALERHGGNQRAAGREVGLSGQAVRSRVKRAKRGSPLAKFQ